MLAKDTKNKRFYFEPIFKDIPDDQVKLDSMLHLAKNQRLYADQLINKKNGATFVLITIDSKTNNSKQRDVAVNDIKQAGDAFSSQTGIQLHYVGLPYIRTEVNSKVKVELEIFLVLSLFITALILLFFFRSWDAVVFPLIIIFVVVIWLLGTLEMLGYNITMLTGLLPPVIVVIGIPNSIYLLNKYHQEIEKHGNKIRAMSHVIRRIGLVALITNFTTAIGFIVLITTDIVILRQFGIAASLMIMATFLVSIILIPAVFSYLPTPDGKQLKHLRFKAIDKALTTLDLLVHRHRYRVLTVTAGLVVIAMIGVMKLHSISYMVDDVPEDSQVKKDLAFFEANFSGIMPLEIVVDTHKKKGILKVNTLKKLNDLEQFLAKQKNISTPVSVLSFLKAARQAFYNNNPKYYALPNKQDRNFILRYFGKDSTGTQLLKSFMDKDMTKMRVSLKVADIGSHKLDNLIQHVVNKKINEVFSDTDIDVKATGTTLLFVKGNKYLVENLRLSLLLAFTLIAIIMAFLFKNVKMILISLIPNLIPLMVTAGIMGYADIPLRPSTALIFSVVFGISVDDSIHFLAKYRQELFAHDFFVPLAISNSIRETGASMIYTSIVLFAGFIIFSMSDFVGTTMLGVLTSTTLLIAMFANLIVLPSLLMAFDSGKRSKDSHPIIEHYDFYSEEEDEEIDLDKISLVDNGNGENLSK
jgi:predicted RND superfamily exporter protein